MGRHYFRESDFECGESVYNPYSQKHVERVWGKPHKAELAGEWMKRTGQTLENISETDRIIWIKPGETILGHTNEFIGGRKSVTTKMQARSSLGRNYIETCKCAGLGDVDFTNRWTMEITNNSRYYSIPLVCGRRVAQIVFLDTDGTLNGSSYAKTGKYQTGSDLKEIMEKWTPYEMLPKLWKDREIVDGPAADLLEDSAETIQNNKQYTKVPPRNNETKEN